MVIKPSLVILVNEVDTMNHLLEDTVKLIHATDRVPAIKRLVTINDIITMNLEIQREFSGMDSIVWDVGSLGALKIHRHEMIVYHSRDFTPPLLLRKFTDRMHGLINSVSHRLQTEI